jgi:hypothetical protein
VVATLIGIFQRDPLALVGLLVLFIRNPLRKSPRVHQWKISPVQQWKIR